MARLQDVLIIGLRADQPLATAVSHGTVYSVSDEGNIQEQSDGTNWIPYGGSGGGGGGGLTQLTGDVAAGPGSGSQVATIQPAVVTNTKLATMVAATIKGRAIATGTGAPVDLTATQATAILNPVVGDAGAGGTKGLVPAPAAGDAAAGKFLKADGTFQVPAGGGGGGITQLVGDVAAGPGSGTQGATIQPDVVTNTQLANMVASTIKGRAAGAGTGDPTDLNGAQTTAILNPFSGDSGAGGVKGLVPAPAAGDGAAGKVLAATGGWVVPAGGGGSVLIGEMKLWPGATIPTDYLLCDGTLYDKTTFAALYSALGGASSPWGQNVTHFNVPDMRDRVPIGASTFTRGTVGGALNHTHAAPAHSHAAGTLTAGSHTHAAGTLAAGSHTHAAGSLVTDSHVHGASGLSVPHGHNLTLSINNAGDHQHGVVGTIDYGGAHGHTVNLNSVGGADTGSGINLVRPGIYTVDTGGDHSHTINLPSTTAGDHSHSYSGGVEGDSPPVSGQTAGAGATISGTSGAAAPAVTGATAGATAGVTGATATDGATTTGAANQAFAAVNYIIKAA